MKTDELAERREVWSGVRETVALELARGEIFDKPPNMLQPHRRISEAERLYRAGVITSHQRGAGERYGALYRNVHDARRGRGGAGLIEDRLSACGKLARIKAVGLGRSPLHSWLCDELCGRGGRIANLGADTRAALEKELVAALKSLSIYYGYEWA